MNAPLILPYASVLPRSAGFDYAGGGAFVIGRVTLGQGAWLAALSVLRGDGNEISVGEHFALGAAATVHISGQYATRIGDGVVVGRNAVIHACVVGHRCVIGADSVILDGSMLEDDVVLEAGSVVFPRSRLEAGTLYAGSPARALRPLASGEAARRNAELRAALRTDAVDSVAPTGQSESRSDFGGLFGASTASVQGATCFAAQTSLWFGCRLDAGRHEIRVGENSNIQDNTRIRCVDGPFIMAANAVIGHNVDLENCTIGEGSLVGIGARVAAGTIIEPDVLLAAGARTEPGQIVERGWVWGGSPLRAISRFDEGKRALVARTCASYVGYAHKFAAAAADR